MKIPLLLVAGFAVIATGCSTLKEPAATKPETANPGVGTRTEEDRAAPELGKKVLALQQAIEHPLAPGSLDAVKALGLDTRYYVMVRGWLSEQLRADLSIRDASKQQTPQKIKDRIAFLEKAIRAIDLER